MPFWNRNIDPALFPLLFSRGQFGFEKGIKLDCVDKKKLYEDDLGEGEQLLDEDEENRIHQRENVSRTQWLRYMMQIRPKKGSKDWRTNHWLWWARRLAQFYTLSQCNRIETEKMNALKKVQKSLRSVLPQSLIQAFEKMVERRAKHGKIIFFH